MSVLTNRPALRWMVPTAAAVVIVGGGAAVGTFSAAADPSLPPRSAAQLLVDLQTAEVDGLSGTVVQRADLGLPAIPNLGGSGAADLAALVSGTHTLRVWYGGPEQVRVALLDTLGESDVIRNGRDVWFWRSRSNEASHHLLPAGETVTGSGPHGLPVTPQEAADQALAAIDPSTKVSVGRSATIAGRDAYELVLDPRDQSSLVDQVRIAVDAETHVPLRFEVFAVGTEEAAFEVAFTQVDFTRPDPAQFTFNPPPGTTVTEETGRSGPASGKPARPDAGEAPQGRLSTVGTGWTTVFVGQAPGSTGAGRPADAGGDADGNGNGTADGTPERFGRLVDGLLPRVSGDWGDGRLLSSRLITVLVVDDGRVLAGAVTPERLYEVARQPR